MAEKQKEEKKKGFIQDTVETIVFVLVAVIIIRFFLGEIRWIPSLSMFPELNIGDRLFVERLTRFYDTPKRGDIMVFYPPDTELSNNIVPLFQRLTGLGCKDIAYIKRVIGLPGEKFEIIINDNGTGQVFINDKLLHEEYIEPEKQYSLCNEDMNCGPAVIPENQYLMLGDNRNNSKDGRYWGLLDKSRFIGRAKFRFWPLNRIKYFKHLDYENVTD